MLAAMTAASAAQIFPSLSPQEQSALESARSHEMRGDERQAFDAYRDFVQLDRDAVDVTLRFAAMARARLGLAEARALLGGMDHLHSPAFRLAVATLTDIPARRKALEVFVTAHPEYGPGYALLANEYRQERFEDQPLRDRLRERELLSRFLGFDAQGRLSPSFVGSAALAAWLDRAERRLAALDAALSGTAAAPSAKFNRSSSSWIVYLNMPERPTAISYRIGDGGPFTPTGVSGSIDPRTGRNIPKVHFMMPLDTPTTTIHLTYRDIGGREAGPFRIAFDPREIILKSDRETIDAQFPGWANFADGESGRDWVYFNTLMYSRCAIRKAEYGFDETPGTVFPLPPCDMRDPHATPADAQSAVQMGPDVKTVSVRLTLIDGTVATRVYRRPAR
jgi:hypothetical protein